jgi:hypothetical protein
MKIDKVIFFIAIMILSFSCKIQPGSDRNNADRTGNVYKLTLNPAVDSKYYYTIANESSETTEVEDKKIEDITKANVGVVYAIKKDSVLAP